MIQYHIFPGGKRRAVTFSYDDGDNKDIRLAQLFTKYGVKGTFHLNSNRYAGFSPQQLAEVARIYAGHEISVHTVHHGLLNNMHFPSAVDEILEDRRALETIAGYPVVGMSYPYGGPRDEAVMAVLRACGIVYSRTVSATGDFQMPVDFLRWDPTCHHKQAMSLCDRFLKQVESSRGCSLFYIWGHSFELSTEEDWNYMEQLVSRLAHNHAIWYATNLEIWQYHTAQRALHISADETVFYNPSAIPVWVEKDAGTVIHIPAGETVRI